MQQVHINEIMLEELKFFSEESEQLVLCEEMLKKSSMALLMKRSSDNLPSAQIDDVVAQMVYGNMRKPPGAENCPYQKLLLKKEEGEYPGIWTAPNSLCKAVAFKWLFPTLSQPFVLPEQKPIPPHVVMAYDAFKYKEVMELSTQYPNAVMKYGFFTNDTPGASQLITKTVEKFEKRLTPPTYDEKIVVQLDKNPEWFEIFLELGPSYMSPDTVQGEVDAKTFFPASYDIPEDIIMEIKKKPKKKGRSKLLAVVEAHEDEIRHIDKQTTTETAGESEDVHTTEETEGATSEDKQPDGEEDDGEEGIEEIDKATSPMDDGKPEEAE